MRSRIDGEWNGWDGDTVVTLANGSRFRSSVTSVFAGLHSAWRG
jgi:hypothetical protein